MNFVFVHGLIGEPSNWDRVVEPMAARGIRCVVPEVAYFDESTCRIQDFAAQLMAKLPPELMTQPSCIVGNSIGCSIALYLADRFSAAYLVAPFTKMYSYTLPRSDSNISGLLTSLVHDPSKLRENEVAIHVERYRALLDSKGRKHHLRKLRNIKAEAESFDHAGLYRERQSKIHMVYAANDEVSPPATFEQMREEFPGMTLHEIPDCGHAVPMEQPGLLAELLMQEVETDQPASIPAE